jgi:putative phage-type endonuclease
MDDLFPVNDKVQALLAIPQFEQRTPEWFAQRQGAVTASDMATVLQENKYKTPWSLLLDKCDANPKPFIGNEATRWGAYYEDIAIEKYCELRNKKVLSFGLLIHPDYPFLGGSVDGLTTDGIVIEVKCPFKRKIVMGEVPHHYLAQVLLNLEICDLEIAHFIEYIPGNSDDDFQMNIVEVKRDREWFAKRLPEMKAFWESVEKYRSIGIDKHPKYSSYKEKIDYNSKKRENIDAGITLNLTTTKKQSMFIEDPENLEEPESVSLFVDSD